MEKRIVVVAGDMEQFKNFIHRIIPVTHKDKVYTLQGLVIEKAYFVGDYYKWVDREDLDRIKALTR